MQHTETTVQTSGGLELYVQRWQADVPTRAVIAIVHGIGEHSGRYMNLVNHLVPRGNVLCGVDLRGHGRSPGPRGHIDRWEDYREDLRSLLQWILTWESAQPRFVLGHSMGALVVLDFVLRHPDGLAGACRQRYADRTCRRGQSAACGHGAPLFPLLAALHPPPELGNCRTISRPRGGEGL